MKPEYRNSALAPRAVNAANLDEVVVQVTSNPVQWLAEHLRDWWQRRKRQHAERIMVESLAPLGNHLLHDLGVSDELKQHALAQRESQYERSGRVEPGGFAGRFSSW